MRFLVYPMFMAALTGLSLPSLCYAQAVDDFQLTDHQGQVYQLSDFSSNELVVLFVQANEDLVSRNALPALRDIRSQFQRRGVTILLINPVNEPSAVSAEAESQNIDFPVLLDTDGDLSNNLGLTLTGEALVLDPGTREILYRGPVNERIDFTMSPEPARNHYLRDALNNILLGSTANFDVPPVKGSPVTDTGYTGDSTMVAVTEFTLEISDEALQDLRTRLANRRLPDQISGTSWEYGTDSAFLQELLTYWENEFDWRAQERMLNEFSQFRMPVDGLNLHFIHQRSPEADATPLLLVHGWPGSVAEFHKIIGPLTNPVAYGGNASDAFHVIAPSLPGFGFSDKPDMPGYSPEKIAHLLAQLMEQLGYSRYGLQGGDWGAIINRYVAGLYPDRVIGLHSNFILAGDPGDAATPASPESLARRETREAYMRNERGYQQIQGTKPQTLGVGLNDSPAGLAAWIVEKFHGWSDIPQDHTGDLTSKFTLDELLTNIAIYWFTETITSSTRIYYENRNTPRTANLDYISVPTAAAVFPAEISATPRAWAEHSYNIVRWTEMPRGGHFAALEEPELLLQDVRAFFRNLQRELQ